MSKGEMGLLIEIRRVGPAPHCCQVSSRLDLTVIPRQHRSGIVRLYQGMLKQGSLGTKGSLLLVSSTQYRGNFASNLS
jgi:hypothetical protein